MASEYLKRLAKDIPRERPRELTRREKLLNWLHYHKWHLLVSALLLWAICDIGCDVLGLRDARPDCQIAYVGSRGLPDETAAALEDALSALCEDLNGDGTQTVKLVQYLFPEEADAELAYASEVRLTADLEACESYLFLLEDPESFQSRYHVLCSLNGTLPADQDDSAETVCLLWRQCPVLADMAQGNAAFSDSACSIERLWIARRGFWTEKTSANLDGCIAFWNALTEGADYER